MNSSHFSTAYKTNYAFFIAYSFLIIIMNMIFNRLHPILFCCYLVFVAVILILLFRGKKPLSEKTHKYLQNISFIILNVFLSITFDSAQVFVYSMCSTAVVTFVFLDQKLSRFNMIHSVLITIIVAGIVSIYTGSKQTMYAFSFGTLVLIVINWVSISMTSIINFQNRQNIEQERSLDDLLKVVEAKCDEAQAATRSKTRFLANMSHEIRTPINSIMGMNEMILRESTEKDICDYASEAKTATESLMSIINDILDISKIESGKLRIIRSNYNLSGLINNVYNLIKFRAEGKNLYFKVTVSEELPSVLYGDELRLKQILLNLLTNAVKYTHNGTITLEITPVSENEMRFSVKDTGIGIKPEDIKFLFNAFDRIEESRNRHIEGTGLGLNITASLLKMLGSELNVQSEYGEGSEFSFVLKQEVVDATPIGKIDVTNQEHHYKKYSSDFEAPDATILVVDDNEMNRKVFINLLKPTKIRISEAKSGMECLAMTSETTYDIIFMDHMMPEMDGIQTLEALRSQEVNLCKNTPVIALTANAVVGAKEFYARKGFDGFLAKPTDPQTLEQTILNTLDKRYIKQRSIECNTTNETEPVPIELPVIDGLDWNYAKLHLNNDKLLVDTVKMFHSAISRDTEELNSYFNEIDDEACRSSYRVKVHSMKSSASMIGIVQLAGMAMELEKAARNHNCDIIKALHPVFIERWLSYREPLSVFAKTDTNKKNALDNIEEIEEIFAQIRSAAEEMDVDILDEMSQRLDEFSFDEASAEKIKEVKAYILNFEVEKLTDYEFNIT